MPPQEAHSVSHCPGVRRTDRPRKPPCSTAPLPSPTDTLSIRGPHRPKHCGNMVTIEPPSVWTQPSAGWDPGPHLRLATAC